MNLRDFSSNKVRLAATMLFGSLCALSICGCGAVESASPAADEIGTTGTISGKVHGGQFPIYNATVSLYMAGTTGYGSAATKLATTTTTAGGEFQFTKLANGSANSGSSWSCPATDPNPDPQIYITSVGGNTSGTTSTTPNNGAAALMVAIGPCSQISTSTPVQINEITTAATVFALAQYINPGSGPGTATIGTNGANTSTNTPQGALGLNNAVAGLANLVYVAYGSAVTSITHTGTNATVSNVTVTATPETSKLITVADILASCINTTASSSSQCTDLFASATAPPLASVTSQPNASFAAAQDTIQAAYYMAVNPVAPGNYSCTTSTATTKMGCLYGLINATAPFQPTLSAAPLDWTIGVTYSATMGCQTSGNTTPFMDSPWRSAVDSYGNLWWVDNDANTSSLKAMSPVGVPLFCVKGSASTVGNFTAASNGLTIDTSGNIWASYMTDSATAGVIYEVPAPGAVPIATTDSAYTAAILGLTATTAIPSPTPSALTADSYGNVFFSINNNDAAAAGQMVVYEIPKGTTIASPPPVAVIAGTNPDAGGSNVVGGADSVGRVYFTSNTSTNATQIFELTPASLGITGYSITGAVITFLTSDSPLTTSPAAVAVGQTVIVSGLTSTDGLLLDRQKLLVTAVSSTGFSAATTLVATTGSVTDSGIAVVVPAGTGSTYYASVVDGINDNFGRAYGAALDQNNYLYTGTDCCGSTQLEEMAKVTISPTGAAVTSAAGNYSFSAQNLGGLTGVRAVALDGADNVWFGNYLPNSDNGTAESQNTGLWSIGELATSGGGSSAAFTALSPAATGLQGTDTCASSSNIGCPIGGGFQKAALETVETIAIDPSGNVWAPVFGTPNQLGDFTSPHGAQAIVEIVGAAVPTVTPLALAAANGTLASKP